MIFRLRLAFLQLLFVGLLGCQTPPPVTAPSFIWEAKRGQQLLTLVGTMHLGTKASELPPLLWQRVDDAEQVLIETDMSALHPLLMQRYWLLPQGESLERMLGPQDWQTFSTLMLKAFPTQSLEQLRRMTPAAACSQLMLAEVAMISPEETAEQSMDVTICQRARGQGKTCGQLETMEDQLGYLKVVFTLAELREMIRLGPGDDYLRLKKAYQEGRSDLIELMIEEMPLAMRRVLLERRNLIWMDKLEALLTPRHTLMAVGAAHFGGEQSLLLLLQKKGFQVRQLPTRQPDL